MKHIKQFIEDTFGPGQPAKFEAAQAFGVSQATIYNWIASQRFWVYETATEYKVIEVKAELLK